MLVRDQLLNYFLVHPEQVHSGQGIADSLNVSRNSVWKAVNQLKEQGYKIESLPNKGYKFLGITKALNGDLIGQQLKALNQDTYIETHEQVTSTNNLAKEYAAQDAQKTGLFISKKQTEGRGRRAKSFYSSLDHGLYFSLVFKVEDIPLDTIPTYTVKAALAMAQSIEKNSDKTVKIKWVNDLFVGGRKVSGILSELITDVENMSPSHLVIGIGLNLAGHFNQADKNVQTVAGTIFPEGLPETFNVNYLLIDFIRNFNTYRHTSDKSFIKDYEKRILGIGQVVNYQINQEEHRGKILGIDEQGHLLVEDKEGLVQTLFGQEISFGSSQFIKD